LAVTFEIVVFEFQQTCDSVIWELGKSITAIRTLNDDFKKSLSVHLYFRSAGIERVPRNIVLRNLFEACRTRLEEADVKRQMTSAKQIADHLATELIGKKLHIADYRDIAGQVFLDFPRILLRYEGPEPFNNYLNSILNNQRYWSKKTVPPYEDSIDTLEESLVVNKGSEFDAVSAVHDLDKLFGLYQKSYPRNAAHDERLLRLTHDQVPDEEIATELGIAPGNVRVRRLRILRRLPRFLEPCKTESLYWRCPLRGDIRVRGQTKLIGRRLVIQRIPSII
jgi:DNA-directed RNA polymerase specialized sigma24 family protein